MSKKRKPNHGAPGATKQKVYEAPVFVTSDQAGEEESDQELLFTIDGTEYWISTKVPAGVALGYIGRLDTKGQEAAVGYLLMKVLGVEAFDALTQYEDLDQESLTAVINRVKTIALGNVTGPKAR